MAVIRRCLSRVWAAGAQWNPLNEIDGRTMLACAVAFSGAKGTQIKYYQPQQ